MNTRRLVFVLLAAAAFCWAGCKKSEEATPAAGAPRARAAAAKETPPAGPVELKLKWPVGRRFVQRLDVLQTNETLLPRSPRPAKQEVTMGQDFALSILKRRDDGGHEVALEFLGTQMLVTSGENTLLSFDSHGESTGEENPVATAFRSLTGAKFKYHLDASNRVEKVEGVQAFRDRISAQAPPQVRTVFSTMLSDEYFKQMMSYGQSLPAKAVNPGESWPVQTEIALGPLGFMVLDMNYTFKGWEKRDQRRCVAVEFAGTIKSKPGASTAQPGVNIAVDDGRSSGKSWFDPEQGMFIESAFTMAMRLRVTLPPTPTRRTNAPAPPTTITNLMTQKITLKLGPAETAVN
jgi:hypothetical protein